MQNIEIINVVNKTSSIVAKGVSYMLGINLIG